MGDDSHLPVNQIEGEGKDMECKNCGKEMDPDGKCLADFFGKAHVPECDTCYRLRTRARHRATLSKQGQEELFHQDWRNEEA